MTPNADFSASQGSHEPTTKVGGNSVPWVQSAPTPFPNPTVTPPPQTAGGLGAQEAAAFAANQDIEKDGKHRDHVRFQKFRDHVNLASLILFWTVCASVFAGILTFSWHMLTPEAWYYLNSDQLEKLKTILGAAVLSSALTGYANKHMK